MLLSVGVTINSHPALYKQLSFHFVRTGQLPPDTASFVVRLYERRLKADYSLDRFTDEQVQQMLDETKAYLDRFEALL